MKCCAVRSTCVSRMSSLMETWSMEVPTISISITLAISCNSLRFCVSELLFSLPLIGEFLRVMGSTAATKETICGAMKHGSNLALLPGGFEEVALYKRGEYAVYLKKRKGFIKYALQHGTLWLLERWQWSLLMVMVMLDDCGCRFRCGSCVFVWWRRDTQCVSVWTITSPSTRQA